MTKLSDIESAAKLAAALRKLRKFRQAYGCESSPTQRAIITLELDCGPEPVTLSPSTRAALNRALDVEDTTLCAALRGLDVSVDMDTHW